MTSPATVNDATGAPTLDQVDREALAKRVVEQVRLVGASLKDLETDIRALWEEFERLQDGETIMGCRTKGEFCDRILGRTPRAVQYMLKGGNPTDKRKKPCETVSRPLTPSSAITPKRAPSPAVTPVTVTFQDSDGSEFLSLLNAPCDTLTQMQALRNEPLGTSCSHPMPKATPPYTSAHPSEAVQWRVHSIDRETEHAFSSLRHAFVTMKYVYGKNEVTPEYLQQVMERMRTLRSLAAAIVQLSQNQLAGYEQTGRLPKRESAMKRT